MKLVIFGVILIIVKMIVVEVVPSSATPNWPVVQPLFTGLSIDFKSLLSSD